MFKHKDKEQDDFEEPYDDEETIDEFIKKHMDDEKPEKKQDFDSFSNSD